MNMTIALILIVASLCFSISSAYDRQVRVDIKANWRQCEGSLAAEISEFLAEDGLFWQYTDALCTSSKYDIESGTEEKGQSDMPSSDAEALDIASNFLPEYTPRAEKQGGYHALMKTTVLGLRTYAPTIRFFESLAEQYGNPCDSQAFVVAYPNGNIMCSKKDIEAWQQQQANASTKNNSGISADNVKQDVTYGSLPQDRDWDHAYENEEKDEIVGQDDKEGAHFVLYGRIGTCYRLAWVGHLE